MPVKILFYLTIDLLAKLSFPQVSLFLSYPCKKNPWVCQNPNLQGITDVFKTT